MASLTRETRNRIAAPVAMLLALTGCFSAAEEAPTTTTQAAAAEETDRRITELEAQVDALQTQIQVLETRAELYADAFDRNVIQLEEEMVELRELARHWIAVADEMGEAAEGVGYWWANAPVRGCSTAVSGVLTPSLSDVEVGPLMLPYAGELAEQRPEAFEPVENGLYRGHKVAVVLEEVVDVLVLVPAKDRTNISLLYQAYRLADPDRRGGGVPLAIAQGERAVIFRGCPGRSQGTQYDGGLVVAGPRCVTLEVYVDESPVAHEVALGFGTRCSES